MNQVFELSIQNFPAQQSIFDAPQRYVIVPKGRRFGATMGAANNFIRAALAGEFKQGLWGDVVNSNIEKYIQRYFMPELMKLPKNIWRWKRDPHTIYINGAYIDFRSAERPESWEGFGYDYAFLNEAGIILKNPYLWENAIKPMFWDSDCRAVIAGTPKGKGEFFKLYQRGLDPQQPDYISMKFTPFDNPYVNHQRIYADMKDMSELAIKQEIYAEFLDDSGVVFRNVSQIAILDPLKLPSVNPEDIYVIGCDLAKVEDFTVIVVYNRRTNNQVFQMRFNKLEWPYIRQRIRDVSRKYNNALIMLDSTGVGEPTHDDLTRMGLPVEGIKFTNTSKKDLINKLSNWIELGHLKMLKLDETIQELNAYSYEISEKTDRFYYGAPVGFHDDIVIAHALAVWSLNPVLVQKPQREMTIIERDMYLKSNPDPDDYEEEERSDFEYDSSYV